MQISERGAKRAKPKKDPRSKQSARPSMHAITKGELHPVREARLERDPMTNRPKPGGAWWLRLACGHEVMRSSERAYARCDALCPARRGEPGAVPQG